MQRPVPEKARSARHAPPARIGVGVDGGAAGRDAVTLGALLARATGGELLLIAVHAEPFVPLTIEGMEWTTLQKQAWALLAETRDALAPQARLAVEADTLEWRGLRHVARSEHCDVLVVGSAHDAKEGHVRLGRHAGELESHLECTLAIAPRGMRHRAGARVDRVGVGFDGDPESQAALELAGALALAADAELCVCGAVDRHSLESWSDQVVGGQEAIVETRLASLSQRARSAARATGARTSLEVVPGAPFELLLGLCDRVDLLVIGSCGSGRRGRIEAGRTGRALLRAARCPVILVPRPPD